MKKLFLLAIATIMMSLSVSAQSIASLGAVVGYGSEMQVATLGVRADVDIKAFTYSPSLNYYFESSSTNLDVTMDFHWNILNKETIKAYPLAGVSFLYMFADGGSASRVGFNLGGGVRYNLSDRWAAIAEAKYQFWVTEFNQAYVSLGVMYRF